MKVRLAEVRTQKLVTQRELAELAGIAQTTISAIELGKQSPRISTVRKLAAALQVDPEELIVSDDR